MQRPEAFNPLDHAKALLEALPDRPSELTVDHLGLVMAAAEGSTRHAVEVRDRQLELASAVLAGEAPADAEQQLTELVTQAAQLLEADALLSPFLEAAAQLERTK